MGDKNWTFPYFFFHSAPFLSIIRHLIDELVPGKCPSLSGKPKMIFVQACQGQKTDDGSDVRVRSRHTSHDGAGGGTNNWYRIPHYADFLVFQVKKNFRIFFAKT